VICCPHAASLKRVSRTHLVVGAYLGQVYQNLSTKTPKDQYSTCLSISTSCLVPKGYEEVKVLSYAFALVWPGHADAPMSDMLTRLDFRRDNGYTSNNLKSRVGVEGEVKDTEPCALYVKYGSHSNAIFKPSTHTGNREAQRPAVGPPAHLVFRTGDQRSTVRNTRPIVCCSVEWKLGLALSYQIRRLFSLRCR